MNLDSLETLLDIAIKYENLHKKTILAFKDDTSAEQLRELIVLLTNNLTTYKSSENDQTIKNNLTQFLSKRWEIIKNSEYNYTHSPYEFINLICVGVANFIDKENKNLLLMPSIDITEDSYGTELNTLRLGQFILTEDNEYFIALESFFESAHARIFSRSEKPFTYINKNYNEIPLNKNQQTIIENIYPDTEEYFTLATEFNTSSEEILKYLKDNSYSQFTTLELLQWLISEMRASSVSAENLTQDEILKREYQSAENINTTLVLIKEWLDSLEPDKKEQLFKYQHPANSSIDIEFIFNNLFKNTNNATNNSATYCLDLLANELELIVDKHHGALAGSTQNPKAHRLEELYQRISRAITEGHQVEEFLHQGKLLELELLLTVYPDLLAYQNGKNQNIIGLCLISNNEEYHTFADMLLSRYPELLHNPACNELTILELAAVNDKPKTLNYLLEKYKNSKLDEKQIYEDFCEAFNTACYAGCMTAAKILLAENPSLINAQDANGYYPIFNAVANNQLKMVEYLIDNKADIHLTSKKQQMLFPLCCEKGHLSIAKLLLAKFPDLLNKLDGEGLSPLMIAAASGHYEIVNYLLENGSDINLALTNDKSTVQDANALFFAINMNHTQIALLLLKYGANFSTDLVITENNTSFKMQLIHLACQKGNQEIVQALLTKNHELIDLPDSLGYSPLLHAVIYNQFDMITLLIKRRANLNLFTNDGYTALHKALLLSNYKIAKLLAEAGIALDNWCKDENDEVHEANEILQIHTIHLACRVGNLYIVNECIKKHKLVNLLDKRGKPPLLHAIEYNQEAIVKFLIEQDADLNVKITNSYANYTALHKALLNKHYQIIELLLDASSNIDNYFEEKDTDGNIYPTHTLHLAYKTGNLEAIKKCITLLKTATVQYPNLINLQDEYGYSLLLHAANDNNIEFAQFLIVQGAELNLKSSADYVYDDFHSYTALHLALIKNHADMVTLLLEAGINIDNHCRYESDSTGTLEIHTIHLACLYGNIETVKKCTEQDNNVVNKIYSHFSNDYSNLKTPLRLAKNEKQFAIVKYLLENKATLSHPASNSTILGADNIELFQWAIKEGRIEIAETLLTLRNVNFTTYFEVMKKNAYGVLIPSQENLMHYTCTYGTKDFVELILKKHPELLNQGNLLGEPPILTAVNNGQLEIVKLLAEKGAQFTYKYKGDAEYSIFHYLIVNTHDDNLALQEKILRTLLRYDSALSLVDNSALYEFANTKCQRKLTYLLSSVNFINKYSEETKRYTDLIVKTSCTNRRELLIALFQGYAQPKDHQWTFDNYWLKQTGPSYAQSIIEQLSHQPSRWNNESMEALIINTLSEYCENMMTSYKIKSVQSVIQNELALRAQFAIGVILAGKFDHYLTQEKYNGNNNNDDNSYNNNIVMHST
ncbi:MAG: hypothetical protein Tsb005_19070 [Gammaproteobacteria bacterium]